MRPPTVTNATWKKKSRSATVDVFFMFSHVFWLCSVSARIPRSLNDWVVSDGVPWCQGGANVKAQGHVAQIGRVQASDSDSFPPKLARSTFPHGKWGPATQATSCNTIQSLVLLNNYSSECVVRKLSKNEHTWLINDNRVSNKVTKSLSLRF